MLKTCAQGVKYWKLRIKEKADKYSTFSKVLHGPKLPYLVTAPFTTSGITAYTMCCIAVNKAAMPVVQVELLLSTPLNKSRSDCVKTGCKMRKTAGYILYIQHDKGLLKQL